MDLNNVNQNVTNHKQEQRDWFKWNMDCNYLHCIQSLQRDIEEF